MNATASIGTTYTTSSTPTTGPLRRDGVAIGYSGRE